MRSGGSGAMLALGAALALSVGGCARKVTLDPEMVPGRNDQAWTIRRAPAATSPAVAVRPSVVPAPSPSASPPPGAPSSNGER